MQGLDGQTATAKPTGAARKGAVVLLSDGTQTHGVLAPNEGAHLAEQAGIPVYTIALGTLSGTVTINRFGAEAVVPVPPDRRDARKHRGGDGRVDVRGDRCRAAQLRL